MSKNGLITISRPFDSRLNLKRLMNNRNAMPRATTRKNGAQRITTFDKEVTE